MRVRTLSVAVIVLSVVGFASAQGAAGFKHENTPENLKRLMETLFRTLHVEKLPTEGTALFRSLLPDDARLQQALRDDIPAADREKIQQAHRNMALAEPRIVATLMGPSQSVVRVRGATTEERMAQMSPDGQRLMKQTLRPGVTFYDVEFLESGRSDGMMHGFFYWDGKQWSWLGPIWRWLKAPAAEGPKAEDATENLRRVMENLYRKLHVEKSPAEGAALFRALSPDAMRLRRALRDDVPRTTLEKIIELHRALIPTDPAMVAKLMEPSQFVVQVHAATTEDLAAGREIPVVFEEFPAGTQSLAKQMLRPGVTFYEVEFVAPGRNQGVKYHLFYWDGSQWSMLGPVWRWVK